VSREIARDQRNSCLHPSRIYAQHREYSFLGPHVPPLIGEKEREREREKEREREGGEREDDRSYAFRFRRKFFFIFHFRDHTYSDLNSCFLYRLKIEEFHCRLVCQCEVSWPCLVLNAQQECVSPRLFPSFMMQVYDII